MGLYTVSPAFIFIKTPWKPREDLYTEANKRSLASGVYGVQHRIDYTTVILLVASETNTNNRL